MGEDGKKVVEMGKDGKKTVEWAKVKGLATNVARQGILHESAQAKEVEKGIREKDTSPKDTAKASATKDVSIAEGLIILPGIVLPTGRSCKLQTTFQASLKCCSLGISRMSTMQQRSSRGKFATVPKNLRSPRTQPALLR